MSNRPTIAYQPALDGVRAVAVVAVLLFHGGVPGFDGGYLGVSVFFTLSGFLITSLLLREHDGSGTIDLPAFYARRLRRLLPASLACLLAVAVVAVTTSFFDGVAGLRAQFFGSLFQVVNWVLLAGDGSYQDLLSQTSGSASPLEHFWSLAIEEQFYWVWPPVMLLLLTKVQRHRGRLVAVGMIAVLASLCAPAIAHLWGPDAAYWSTPARVGEIIVGAFLAVVLAGRRVSPRFAPVAPVALTALLACIVLFPSSSGPAYAGALPLIAVISAGLVLGLQVPSTLRPLLELGGVVWVGKLSYGLYLFHWPIFVLVDRERFDVPGPLLFAVRILLTFTVAVASYEVIERPIRRTGALGPRAIFAGAVVSTAAVAIVAVAIPAGIGGYWNPDADKVEAASIEVMESPPGALVASSTTPAPSSPARSSPPPPPTPPSVDTTTTIRTTSTTTSTTTSIALPAPVSSPPAASTTVPEPPPLPALARPVRIVVIGDSTAKAFGTGLVNWAAEHPELAQVEVSAAPGCGFLVGGERRTGDEIAPIEGCSGWVEHFVYPEVERLRPDVVMAMVTSWDIGDRRWTGEALITPLDDEYAERIETDYRQLATQLVDSGAGAVAFVRHPVPDPFWLTRSQAEDDPARHAVIYDIEERIAAIDDRVSVVALDRWITEHGLDRSKAVRPDGIHPAPEAATEIAAQYLGDRLIRIALGVPHS